MIWELLDINPRIIASTKQANLKSAKEILSLSASDLQRLTNLSQSEVQQLQIAVAGTYRKSSPVTALQLHHGEYQSNSLTLACPVLDTLLRGGVPLNGITELAGESGAGKTQIGLQLCLSVQYPLKYGGLSSGAVYICTEDSFPIKRLRQLITQQALLRPKLPRDLIRMIHFSDNIYIEHASDFEALKTCISYRVPILLSRGLVRLVVVDSVAALFRNEFQVDQTIERARHLLSFARSIQHLSHFYNAPVLCINQVTDVMDNSNLEQCHFGMTGSRVLPALGMVWANQVMVRLMLRRLDGSVGTEPHSSVPRRLEVVFAPHLPQASCLCGIWNEGVKGVADPYLFF